MPWLVCDLRTLMFGAERLQTAGPCVSFNLWVRGADCCCAVSHYICVWSLYSVGVDCHCHKINDTHLFAFKPYAVYRWSRACGFLCTKLMLSAWFKSIERLNLNLFIFQIVNVFKELAHSMFRRCTLMFIQTGNKLRSKLMSITHSEIVNAV